jgi:hypothetical protein
MTSSTFESSTPVTDYDVICARGSQARNHIGNRKFRQKIKDSISSYSDANSRQAKSILVSEVLDWIISNGGEFIRISDSNERQPVGDHLAREKIGQAFRDSLHSKYKSSTKAKRQRWRLEKLERAIKLDTNPRSQKDLEMSVLSKHKFSQHSLRLVKQLKGFSQLSSHHEAAALPDSVNARLFSSFKSNSPKASYLSQAELDAIVLSNARVVQHIHNLAMDMKRRCVLGGLARVSLINGMFNQTNVDISQFINGDLRFRIV